MKVTKENIEELDISTQRSILYAFLEDVEELNSILNKKLYIDCQDYHNEYSTERTDPCPDYYGYFSLRFEEEPNECLGEFMTIEDIDNALYLLYDFIKVYFKKN